MKRKRKDPLAVILGRRGGKVQSEAKKTAARIRMAKVVDDKGTTQAQAIAFARWLNQETLPKA